MYSSGLKLLHFLEPELAHYIAIKFLKFSRRKKFRFESDRLKTEVAGLNLYHPVGLSGGFDKNGEIIQASFNFGASFTEIGAITPLPQKGNQKPRVFRLWEDLGLINRLGFNNHGIDAVQKRMSEARPLGIVGINIGANRKSENKLEDYVNVLKKCEKHFDFATINISSPNTPNLRILQSKNNLTDLLSAVCEMNNSFSKPIKIFLKIDPDTNLKRLEEIVEVSVKFKLDGLIATNTTVSRNNLNSKNKNEKGGLSGRPIFSISTKRLAELFSISSGEIPLIGVGGIFSGEDAYEKIKAGASALQIYTAIGYKGIGVIEEIVKSLDTLLKKDGVQSIKSVTGIDHKKWLS